MKFAVFLLIITLFACTSKTERIEKVVIIPKPNQLTSTPGCYSLSEKLLVSMNSNSLESIVKQFQADISSKLEIEYSDEKRSNLVITLNQPEINTEAYQLYIINKKIEISANSKKGIFYGLQSLKQLILFSRTENGKILIPHVSIDDEPRFEWRGLMLDEARHFFGKEKVMELLDIMAMHKLNIFHWHLTDADGWRIEIKQYPKLTTVGAMGNYIDPEAPTKFYTQEEIKEIVQYAADRYIEIIPEIDMPGHASAANRAYPKFSGGGSKSHPEFTFNPGKTGTYSYLTNILKEISTLFPSKYIHLGGDEVHYGNEKWNTNSDVLKLMKAENLKNLEDVETYFVKRMADSINSLNKTVIGWDEIVDHNLNNDNSLVMWWRHNKTDKLQIALEKDYNVVLCPRIPMYFDFVQDKNHEWGRKWGGKFGSMELTYAFPPDTLPGFTQKINLIKGIQANIWTEKIHNNKRLDFMTHPRLSAMSEAAWTNENMKNTEDFKERLKSLLNYFDKHGVYYYNPFNPDATPEPVGVNKKKKEFIKSNLNKP